MRASASGATRDAYTRVVVSATGDATGGLNSGSAYVYDLTSTKPTVPIAILNNPSPAGRNGGSLAGSFNGWNA